MSSVQVISEKDNYTAVNVGKLCDLDKYELKGADGKVMATGKVFLKDAIKATGSQISYTVIQPGQTGPFFHLHHKNEEIYMILKGSGEYQVEDDIIPITEGSVVRIGVEASRNIKNTGSEPMIVICFQSLADSFPSEPEYAITQTTPKFTK